MTRRRLPTKKKDKKKADLGIGLGIHDLLSSEDDDWELLLPLPVTLSSWAVSFNNNPEQTCREFCSLTKKKHRREPKEKGRTSWETSKGSPQFQTET